GGVDPEPLGAHQHLAVCGHRERLSVAAEVVVPDEALGSLGEQHPAVQQVPHVAGLYLTARQVHRRTEPRCTPTMGAAGLPATAVDRLAQRWAASVSGAARLVGCRMTEGDGADGAPAFGNAE